jgi:hypothetical protein
VSTYFERYLSQATAGTLLEIQRNIIDFPNYFDKTDLELIKAELVKRGFIPPVAAMSSEAVIGALKNAEANFSVYLNNGDAIVGVLVDIQSRTVTLFTENGIS